MRVENDQTKESVHRKRFTEARLLVCGWRMKAVAVFVGLFTLQAVRAQLSILNRKC